MSQNQEDIMELRRDTLLEADKIWINCQTCTLHPNRNLRFQKNAICQACEHHQALKDCGEILNETILMLRKVRANKD